MTANMKDARPLFKRGRPYNRDIILCHLACTAVYERIVVRELKNFCEELRRRLAQYNVRPSVQPIATSDKDYSEAAKYFCDHYERIRIIITNRYDLKEKISNKYGRNCFERSSGRPIRYIKVSDFNQGTLEEVWKDVKKSVERKKF